MKIGKMKAKWVQITFEQKRKGKINSKNYQGLLANGVEVYVTPYRQRGKKDPYMHESVGPVTCITLQKWKSFSTCTVVHGKGLRGIQWQPI